MAIYLSNLMQNGGLNLRGAYAGQRAEVTARVLIPSGATLTDGDIIKFARAPDGFKLEEVEFISSADLDPGTDALTGSFGYVRAVENPAKALNATTNPAVSGSVGTDNSDYWIADGANAFRTAFLQADAPAQQKWIAGDGGTVNELATITAVDGVADIAIEVTTSANAAVAADTYLDVRLVYAGAMQAEDGEYYDYKADYDL